MAKLCNDSETFVQLPESVPIRYNYTSEKWANSKKQKKRKKLSCDKSATAIIIQPVFLLLGRGHNQPAIKINSCVYHSLYNHYNGC